MNYENIYIICTLLNSSGVPFQTQTNIADIAALKTQYETGAETNIFMIPCMSNLSHYWFGAIGVCSTSGTSKIEIVSAGWSLSSLHVEIYCK